MTSMTFTKGTNIKVFERLMLHGNVGAKAVTGILLDWGAMIGTDYIINIIFTSSK